MFAQMLYGAVPARWRHASTHNTCRSINERPVKAPLVLYSVARVQESLGACPPSVPLTIGHWWTPTSRRLLVAATEVLMC